MPILFFLCFVRANIFCFSVVFLFFLLLINYIKNINFFQTLLLTNGYFIVYTVSEDKKKAYLNAKALPKVSAQHNAIKLVNLTLFYTEKRKDIGLCFQQNLQKGIRANVLSSF